MADTNLSEPALSFQYIAGFLDGEGTIRKRTPPRACPEVTLSQALREDMVLARIGKFLEANGIRYKIYTHAPNRLSTLPIQFLKILDNRSQQIFLQAVVPFLIVKRTLAVNALVYLEQSLRLKREQRERHEYVVAQYLRGQLLGPLCKEYGIDSRSIHRILVARGIARRTLSESMTIWAAQRKAA